MRNVIYGHWRKRGSATLDFSYIWFLKISCFNSKFRVWTLNFKQKPTVPLLALSQLLLFMSFSFYILGASVFHISIASGNEELIILILDYLLKGGVSRLSMESILSPLSLAVLFHKNSILKLLICKSFNVNIGTPLTGKFL